MKKYTPIIAALVAVTGLTTAYQVYAKVTTPRYNLKFAFGDHTELSIEVAASDTFHVESRVDDKTFAVSGTLVPDHDSFAVNVTTSKEVREAVSGPNNSLGTTAKRQRCGALIILRPDGSHMPVGGNVDEPFTMSLSPARVR